MKKLTNKQIQSRALAIKQARLTIVKTVFITNDRQPVVFDENRVAELQACAVILSRAEHDLWAAYKPKES